MLLLKQIATWCHSCPAEVGPTGHLPAFSHPVAHEAWNTQLSISGAVLQVNFSASDTPCTAGPVISVQEDKRIAGCFSSMIPL